MATLFTIALIVILLAATFAVWQLNATYQTAIEFLRADNKELRDRLFQSKGLAPTGIDLTEKYVEKKEQQKREVEATKGKRNRSVGPIEQLEAEWTKKDKKLAEKGVKAT